MGEARLRRVAGWLYSGIMLSRQIRTLQSLVANGVLAVLFAAVPTSATAEAWVAVDNGKGYRYEFDSDAVERVTNGVYRVKWRWGIEFVNHFSTDTLRVECGEHKVVTERSVSFNRSMYPAEPDKQVFTTDFTEGASTSFWGKKPLSADEKMRAVRFPTSGSPESRLVRTLCQNEPFFRQFHEVAGEEVQKQWGCGSPRLANAPMCKPDLETRELLGQLLMRTDQVNKACAVGAEQTNLIMRVWLKAVEACRGTGGTVCDVEILRMQVSGLGGDLSSAAAGQRCNYAPGAIERARLDEARDASVAVFRKCLDETIPKLDDKVSPANVVAEGVYASCRGQLTPDLASNATFTARAIPGITAQVLQARQESGKPTPKPQPKQAPKPKAQPAESSWPRV
jgi:hypothetical protein